MQRWLNCTIKHLSMLRINRNGHPASHLRISGIPLYPQIAHTIDYCEYCDHLNECIHSTDNQKEAWVEK